MVILYSFYSAPFLANNLNKVRDQVPVVQRVDSAMHWMMQIILIAIIHCVVIYPVKIVIHPLNNRFCSISLLIIIIFTCVEIYLFIYLPFFLKLTVNLFFLNLNHLPWLFQAQINLLLT